MRAMLTPPYHFGIVAAPVGGGGGTGAEATATNGPSQILYRGAFPAARNAPFLNRLGIKTLVCLRKKAFTDEDPVTGWARRKGIDVHWVKAERMGEETLGMERDEVNDILLNPAAYPIYLADIDGISHTTLIVACLRKLQGWHQDSIVNEIYRFEPDHDDLPLVPFITNYLSTSLPSKDDPGAALLLPPPPYPTWLWPATPPCPPAPQSTRTTPPTTKTDRSGSNASASSAGPQGSLPFPNPLTARRHPNMRLTFSSVPHPPAPPETSARGAAGVSRSNTVLSRTSNGDRPRPASPSRSREQTLSQTADESRNLPYPRRVSFSDNAKGNGALVSSPLAMPTVPAPTIGSVLRRPTDLENVSTAVDESALDDAEDSAFALDDDDGEIEEEEEAEVGDDYDDDEDSEDYDEDEDEDEEEEDEEDEPPTSQFISALDLAGY